MALLADLICQLDQLDDELVLYAAPPWRPSSPAVALREPADGTLPPRARGMTYLVDAAQAKRIAAERRRYLGAHDLDDLCRAIIYYGIYDELEPPPSTHGVRGFDGAADAGVLASA
jgi:hypothetical protein